MYDFYFLIDLTTSIGNGWVGLYLFQLHKYLTKVFSFSFEFETGRRISAVTVCYILILMPNGIADKGIFPTFAHLILGMFYLF